MKSNDGLLIYDYMRLHLGYHTIRLTQYQNHSYDDNTPELKQSTS